jgi:hypothetical protein
LQDEEQVIPPVVENTYCRIFGSVRSNQGKKYVFIYRIVNLDDLNDLTRHILEVMYSSLKIQKIGTSVMVSESKVTMEVCCFVIAAMFLFV